MLRYPEDTAEKRSIALRLRPSIVVRAPLPDESHRNTLGFKFPRRPKGRYKLGIHRFVWPLRVGICTCNDHFEHIHGVNKVLPTKLLFNHGTSQVWRVGWVRSAVSIFSCCIPPPPPPPPPKQKAQPQPANHRAISYVFCVENDEV